MDTKMDIKVEFPCKVCNKDYSSYKSLWNHNKKFHNTNSVNVKKNVEIVEKNKSLICDYLSRFLLFL